MNKLTKAQIEEAVKEMFWKKFWKVMKWVGITGTISTATLVTTLLIQTLNFDFVLGYIFIMLFVMLAFFGYVESEDYD